MKGKCKKILSLALVLVLVVQLFVGLGNEAHAENITPLTITGLDGYYVTGSTEQIGLSVTGDILNTTNWPAGFMHSGAIQLNGEPQNTDNWRFQATGPNNINIVCFSYTPETGDIITIPAGTQIRCEKLLYEFANEYSIVYDGTTWSYLDWGIRVETATPITIIKREGYDVFGNGLEQIGFTVQETITGGENWPDCDINYGMVYLNDKVQPSWYIFTTATNQFTLACKNYVPETGDVIKIPAGTQFTFTTDSSSVFEITNTYAVEWNGTTWVEKPIELTLSELNVNTTQVTTGGQGYLYQICIATNQKETVVNWNSGTDTTAEVYLNNDTQPIYATSLWNTTGGELFVQLDLPTNTMVNSITIKKGTQYTILGTTYEVTSEDYTVYYYDGDLHATPQEATGLTLGALSGNSRVIEGGQGYLYQICIATNQTGTVVNWNSGTDTTAEVYLNNATESTYATALWNTEGGELFMQLDLPTDTVVNSITIKKGTQYTILGTTYEVTSEDYTVYYYDGGLHSALKVEATPLTFGEINDATSRIVEGGKGYIYQLCIATNQKNTVVNWNSGTDTTAEVYLNDDTDPINATALWNTEGGELFVQLDLPTDTVVNSITIKKGTEYTILGTTYKVTSEDYTVYCYDGDLHSAPKVEATPLTFGELGGNTRVVTGGKGYVYQLCIATNQKNTVVNWDSGTDTTAEVYLNDDTDPINATALWNTDGGELFVQLDLPKETVVNSITIKKGTEYTILGTTYEVTSEDYTIFHKNGKFATSMLYDITMTVDGVKTVETVSGDYVLPKATTQDGYMTLGWNVSGGDIAQGLYKVGSALPADMNGYTIEAVYAEFSQLKGAQVRLAGPENEKTAGIRFICKLGKDSKLDCITQMGVLVMPTDYMKDDDELTHDNYPKQTDDYTNVKGYRQFVLDLNSEDVKPETIDLGGEETGEEAYYLRAAIVDLYSYNYTRSYSARSFLAVQYAGEEEPTYVYTDYSKEDNERRICDIAKKMIETDPNEYGPAKNKYPIVYKYAKVADTMESFAFFGPKVVVTDGVYDVTGTQKAMKKYAAMGFKYLLMDDDAYHIDGTYTTTTWEQEQEIYNNPKPRLPQFYLKKTMEIARQAGLEVIVNDAALIGLSKSNIPLVETAESKDQVIAACLMYSDGNTVELLGKDIDESKFDDNKTNYTYDGQETTVLHYVEQFDNYEALKNWVAIKMSAYAKEDNFRGVRLVDEPSSDQFAAVALMTKVIKELYPNAYVQSSSLQSYSTRNDIEKKYTNWVRYWDNLLSTHTNATEVGINFYPYRKGEYFVSYDVHDNYLSSLQKLATTTRDRGLNLEFTIQAYANENGYLTVDAAKLALQMHLALAFGTDNLGYFRYSGLGVTENGGGGEINQTIESDTDLAAAVLSANRNGNYLKSHMTFFEYQGSMVFNSNYNEYVTTDNYESGSFDHVIKEVSNSAPILINQFKNEHTGQYGYYVVNLAKLHNTDMGFAGGGNLIPNAPITITLKQDCVVYQDYTQYAYDADKNEEVTNKVNSVTLSDGQGAFIVVD